MYVGAHSTVCAPTAACCLCFVYQSCNMIFVIKGGTDSEAWKMTSANPSPHRFLPLQLTVYASLRLPPGHRASAALKQRTTPLEPSPRRDTLLEAP